MSAKEEVEENRALVEYNGSASRINETGLQVYPVSEYDSGEGLPYAPVDWPNAGDKWGWRAGKKATGLGTYKDRYLYLPKRFQALKDGKKYVFRSKISVKKYLQSEYPGMDINQFFASFSWMIPSRQLPSSKDIDFDSVMKERTTSSGTKMQPLLDDSPIRAITLSLVFAKTVVVSFAVNLSVWTMMGTVTFDVKQPQMATCFPYLECALRAYMAGTVGGSISLDAEYLCRYCDSRTDLVPHALKLLNICTSVASHADIEKILNVGICVLHDTQKRSGKELLHRIESIKAKLTKGVSIQDAFRKESCVDSNTKSGTLQVLNLSQKKRR